MADLRGFDATEVEPNAPRDPLPEGRYLCVIVNSEMKPTKSGSGQFLELELEVIDGPHKGRRVWDRLNLQNPNETAVRIAQGTLSAICRAVGVLRPNDSCELHNLPLEVVVKCKKREDKPDEWTNEIRGYEKRGSSAASAPSAKPVAAGAAPSTPPWKR